MNESITIIPVVHFSMDRPRLSVCCYGLIQLRFEEVGSSEIDSKFQCCLFTASSVDQQQKPEDNDDVIGNYRYVCSYCAVGLTSVECNFLDESNHKILISQ